MTVVSVQLEDTAGMRGDTTTGRVTHLSIPNAKLMHPFYEPLQLLLISNADRGSEEVDSPADPPYLDG